MGYQIAAIIYLLTGFAVARKFCAEETVPPIAIAASVYFWPVVLGMKYYVYRLEREGEDRPLNVSPRPEKKLGTGKQNPKKDSSDQ